MGNILSRFDCWNLNRMIVVYQSKLSYRFHSKFVLFISFALDFFFFFFVKVFICTSKRYHGDYTTDTTWIQLLNVWRIFKVLSHIRSGVLCVAVDVGVAATAPSFTFIMNWTLNTEHSATIEHVYRLFIFCSYPTEYFVFCFVNRWFYSYPFGRVEFSCCFPSEFSLFSILFLHAHH